MTRRRAALCSGGIHLVLAVASLWFAARLAVGSRDARCDGGGSCAALGMIFLLLGPITYVGALGLWLCVQSRLLRSLLGRKSPRQTSAVVLHVAAGLTALIGGIALGGWWWWAGFCAATTVVPGLVTAWAAQPLDPAHPYVPIWRRPGW